ncbi:phosphotransferase [Thiohalocapsa marina]|uniref:Phosphotransferase n=1 Tax=Thiohalocapsa marina TaxID=424902 RepID=A0A5M8FV98_9GAMM|nr:phosphotransferase [Thiohalocapsa marina]KAA6187737.1 phosphotransferase [Thiohalocapsa marina]
MKVGSTPALTARAIARRFLGATDDLAIAPLGAGLINRTYRVDQGQDSFVLQCLNPRVFPAPEAVMANLVRLQARARAHPECGVRVPALIRTPAGEDWLRDDHGHLWRLLEFIRPSRVLRALETPRQAAAIGRALGRFHRLLAPLDPASFALALPAFHCTTSYLARLDALLAGAAASNGPVDAPSDATIAPLLQFIDARRPLAGVLEQALAAGITQERIVHGDPKLDNLLFAPDTDRVLCLIDLDTVQPGLLHHDLGDCLRSCCNRAGEQAGEQASASFDLALCEAILNAYAAETPGLLSAEEQALLPAAVQLIPFELCIRFLTDHLQGDRYFKVSAAGENRVRAERQFALVADIERKAPALRDIVQRAFAPTTVGI